MDNCKKPQTKYFYRQISCFALSIHFIKVVAYEKLSLFLFFSSFTKWSDVESETDTSI
jgi:hypothetical protein